MNKYIAILFSAFLFLGCEEKDPEVKKIRTCEEACEEITESQQEYDQCVIDCESTY